MSTRFEKCLADLLKHEGGFVNHPSDPGGMTNLGVTKTVWENWVDRKVDEFAMRALTPEKVAPRYKDMYWDEVRADALPVGLDYCVFDAAVNSGLVRAKKWLQMTVNATPDGIIGEATMHAVKGVVPANAIKTYCAYRIGFLRTLNTWPTFGKGWERRVKEVEATAIKDQQ